jgi:hypothetical protein
LILTTIVCEKLNQEIGWVNKFNDMDPSPDPNPTIQHVTTILNYGE